MLHPSVHPSSEQEWENKAVPVVFLLNPKIPGKELGLGSCFLCQEFPVPVPSLLSAPGNLFQRFDLILGVFPWKRGCWSFWKAQEGLFILGIFSAAAAVYPDVAVPEFGGNLGLFSFVQSRFSPKSVGCGEGGAAKALLEVVVFPEGSGSSHRALITKIPISP